MAFTWFNVPGSGKNNQLAVDNNMEIAWLNLDD